MLDKLFDSLEEAEASYKEMASIYVSIMLHHQLATASYAGTMQGMGEQALEAEAAGKPIPDDELVLMALMYQIVEARQIECLGMLRMGKTERLPIPGINGKKLCKMIESRMESARTHWLKAGNKEDRKHTLEELLAKINENKDKMGLDSEQTED